MLLCGRWFVCLFFLQGSPLLVNKLSVWKQLEIQNGPPTPVLQDSMFLVSIFPFTGSYILVINECQLFLMKHYYSHFRGKYRTSVTPFLLQSVLISIQKDSDLIFLLASSINIKLHYRWETRKKSHTELSVLLELLFFIFTLKYLFYGIILYLGSYQNRFHLDQLLCKHKIVSASVIKYLQCILIQCVAIK